MKKKMYLVSGIPCAMTERSKELRTDMRLFRENDQKVSARIPLTPIQALMVKIQIIHYNLTHPCYMELTKLRAKRYRV